MDNREFVQRPTELLIHRWEHWDVGKASKPPRHFEKLPHGPFSFPGVLSRLNNCPIFLSAFLLPELPVVEFYRLVSSAFS